MPFTKDSERIKSSIDLSLKSIHFDIQNNMEIEFVENALVGKRPLPVGKNSPFMVVGQTPTVYDMNEFFDKNNKESTEKIENLCTALGLNKQDLYLTYAIKYPLNSDVVEPFFKDGKRHAKTFLFPEIVAVQPDIIFVMGTWTQKLFEKLFHFTFKNEMQKVVLNLKIKGKNLEYETYLYPIGNQKSYDDIEDIIKEIKVNWRFVHLHVHNNLSFKDGVGTPCKEIQRVQRLSRGHRNNLVSDCLYAFYQSNWHNFCIS